MPQIGWKDPASGTEQGFDHWLQEAEAFGQALDMPYEILAGIAEQVQGKDRPDGITVTQLNGCPRAVHIERLFDYYVEPLDNYFAFRGTLTHGVLEQFGDPVAVKEQRYYRTYRDIRISGQVDTWRIVGTDNDAWYTHLWDTWLSVDFGMPETKPELPKGARFRIRDFKSKHDVPTGTYLAKRYQQQGNLYAWLLQVPSPDMLDCEFVFVSMNGIRVMSLFNGGTFGNGRAKPVQIWGPAQTEKFLDERLIPLAISRELDKPIPYAKVNDDDLWQCDWCPVRKMCYKMAVDEMYEDFKQGKKPDRLPPRERK